MSGEELMNRHIKKMIMGGLIILIIILIVKVAFAGLVVPLNRHFVYEGKKWYQFGKEKEFFTVKATVYNPQKVGQEFALKAAIIDITDDGKITPTNEKMGIEPNKVDLAPGEKATIKLFFKIRPGSSTLAVFIASPKSAAGGKGIKFLVSQGYVFGVSFVKGKMEHKPILEAHKKNGKVIARVKNAGKYLMEGNLHFMKGDGNENKHFFLQAGRQRVVEIDDDGCSAVVLDVSTMDKKLGVRFH